MTFRSIHTRAIATTIAVLIHNARSSHCNPGCSFIPPSHRQSAPTTEPQCTSSSHRLNHRSTLTTPSALPTGDGDNNDKESSEDESWKGFNPFERRTTSSSVPSILSSPTLSVRKLQMQQLMNDLLLNVPSDDEGDGGGALNEILERNVELLMEPLEEDGAMVGMDGDSIYDQGMTREERFGRYDSVMREREARAVNRGVRRVLGVMREFVMARR